MTSPSRWRVLHRKRAPSYQGGSPVRTALGYKGRRCRARDRLWYPLWLPLLPLRVHAHDVLLPDLLEALEITESEVQDIHVMRDGHYGQFHQYGLVEST